MKEAQSRRAVGLEMARRVSRRDGGTGHRTLFADPGKKQQAGLADRAIPESPRRGDASAKVATALSGVAITTLMVPSPSCRGRNAAERRSLATRPRRCLRPVLTSRRCGAPGRRQRQAGGAACESRIRRWAAEVSSGRYGRACRMHGTSWQHDRSCCPTGHRHSRNRQYRPISGRGFLGWLEDCHGLLSPKPRGGQIRWGRITAGAACGVWNTIESGNYTITEIVLEHQYP